MKTISNNMRQYFTERVANTFRWLRVAAVMGVMMICCIPTMAQIVPTTDTDGNGTIEDSEKKLYLIQANKFASFYMVAKGNEVNTANLPHSDMLWYFLEAENDSGTQYYYIVNNSTGKYICNTDYSSKGRTIGLLTFDSSSTDKFKFKLVDKTGGFYNISIKPNGGTWIGLNKRGGNVGTEAVRLTDNAYINDGNSKWKFIAFDDSFSWPDPPFTLSPGESKTYYKIHNKQETSYYVSTGSGSPKYVTFSSTVSDDMAWYFVEAPTDNTGMKVRYYYIINPEAEDQYMYFRGNTGTSNQSDAVEVKAKSGENEDRYQFFVVLAARTTGGSAETPVECYMIVPKLLIGNLWNSNSFGSTSISEGSNMGIISGRANDSKAHWTFEETAYTPHCATPVITFDHTTSMVSISSATPGSTIYYTTNGDTPSTSSSEYSGPFSVTTTTTVKAIATHAGYYDSEIATLLITQVATPTIQDNGSNAISITSATEGATIYYTTDGSTPNTSSTVYTEPLTENVSNVTIKAIAVKENMITSEVGSGSVTLRCATPVITREGLTFTLSCSMPTDASLYYTLEGGSEILYSGPVSFTSGQLPLTVTAVARHSSYNQSDLATVVLTNGSGTLGDPYLIYTDEDYSNFVTNVNNGTTSSACYKLEIDVSASGTNPITTTFTGSFDGGLHIITGLTHPLFNIVNGGMVKNVILKEVEISEEGNVGAICGEAKGYSRIYNCGILPTTASFPNDTHSSVTATGTDACVGGIVGKLEDDSRVVNCFSYADVSSTGFAAGIVGNNTFASTAEVSDGKYYKLRTMVVNCMFYGDITAGSNVWPVYGGEKIINGGGSGDDISDGLYAINNYNFYSDSCSFPAGKEPSTTHIYNCSWPAKYEYLTRYEFHRYLLNSNRELCGWWVGAPQAPSTMTTDDVKAVPKDASLMAKWVLDRSVAPFPILKPFGYYPSPINIDAVAAWRESANEWEGKKLGMLSVTVNPGDHAVSGLGSMTQNIVITDMDTIHGDYSYRKIQLPYYNSVFGNPNGTTWAAKYGGNYGEYAVTGWEITKVNGSSTGTGDFVYNWESGYNFADRNSTKKDLYSVSGRIFAQGGYYYVPNDVTNIEITAHWGKAVYLGNGDNYYDRVDFDYLCRKQNNNTSVAEIIRQNRPGTAFEPAGTRPSTLGNGQPVRTGKIADVATNYIANSGTVFDNALVLVGNHQYCTGNESVSPSRSFTIMSADFDLDNEPDYCLDWQLGMGVQRFEICPIRFDFLPVVEIGLGLKKDGSTQYYSLGCYHPKGHFEVTETALIRFGQFEFSSRQTTDCPLILNGGIYDQYVKGTTGAGNADHDKITYVIIGGNLKMLSFTPGAHVNSGYTYSTRHCAVNAIGGRFESLYLSGNFNERVTPNADNPHCYIDGGWFGHVAAAGKEGIGNPNASDPKGNVTFKINHAVIHEFYGGGIMTGHEVTGKIDVTIDNSLVKKYCGGPKFGDMTSGKSVTTSATGTTFGVYYGAGNGGTNYVQYDRTDNTAFNNDGYNWNGTGTNAGHINNYSPGAYRNTATGYQADYDMELINVSTGTFYDCAVNRTYFYAAQYAATNTGPVSNTLTNCIVKTNFYGAGLLGGVDGDVISTLTDTEVKGSVFGAGFSADIPTVTIYNRDKVPPTIDLYTGKVTPQSGGTCHTYKWTHTSGSTSSPITLTPGADGITKFDFFYTETPLVNLGTVQGNATLTIQGKSTIGTLEGGVLKPGTGNVFGGGDESAVNGNTLVKVFGQTKVLGNIYGGGNMGNIGGNTKVIINGNTLH